MEGDGVVHSTTERGHPFGNNAIERLNGVIKNTVMPGIFEKQRERGGGVCFRELVDEVVKDYNDHRPHSLFDETPRVVEIEMLDMDREKIEGLGSGKVNTEKGGMIRKEIKKSIKIHMEEEIIKPSLEEYGECGGDIGRLTKFMRSVVVNPLMGKIEELQRENREDRLAWKREREEMQRKYNELWEIVNKNVKKVAARGLEKERVRQKRREMLNVKGDVLKKVMGAVEGLKGKKRYRVEIGVRMMYITGMRVGGLLLLTDNWFKENILENESGDMMIELTKQRGGERRRVVVGISDWDKKKIGGLYKEYKDLYGEGLYKISRTKLTMDMNKVLGVVGTTSHSLRYTRITEVARNRGIEVAKQYVGHKQIETTNRYVFNILEEEMRKALAKKADVKGGVNEDVITIGELREKGWLDGRD